MVETIYDSLQRARSTLPVGKVPASFGSVLASSAAETWRGWVTGFRSREELRYLAEADAVLREKLGETLFTPDVTPPGAEADPRVLRFHPGVLEKAKRRLFELAGKHRIKGLPVDEESFRKVVGERIRAVEEEAASKFARGPAGWRWVARFAGGAAAAVADPFVLPTLFIGAAPEAASLVRLLLREAAVGGVSEALVQSQVQPARAELGLEAGLDQAAFMVLLAAGGGPLAVGLGRGVGRVWGELAARARAARIEHPAVDVLEAAAKTAEEAPPGMTLRAYARRAEEAAAALEAEVPPPKPAEREALPVEPRRRPAKEAPEPEVEPAVKVDEADEALPSASEFGKLVAEVAQRRAVRAAVREVAAQMPEEVRQRVAALVREAKEINSLKKRAAFLRERLKLAPEQAEQAARAVGRIRKEVLAEFETVPSSPPAAREPVSRVEQAKEAQGAPTLTMLPRPKVAREAKAEVPNRGEVPREGRPEVAGRTGRGAETTLDKQSDEMLNVLRNKSQDVKVRIVDEDGTERSATVREVVEQVEQDEKVLQATQACVGRVYGPSKKRTGKK